MISVQSNLLRAAITRARLIIQRSAGSALIFQSIVVQAKPSNAWLTLTAANIDAQIAVDVDADIDSPLDLCVDAERLALALNASGDTTKLSMDGERLKVAIGKSVFRFATHKSSDFPMLQTQQEEPMAPFDCAWLAGALSRVLPFTGSSDAPMLYARGIRLRGDGKMARVDGTTGQMCATVERPFVTDGNFEMMLPRRVAEVLVAIEPTRAVCRPGFALFMGENVQLASKFLAISIPDLSRVYPAPDGEAIGVNRAEFVAAVGAVAALTEPTLRHRVLLMEHDTNGLTVSSTGIEGDARAEVRAQGAKIESHFDSDFLLTLADAGDGDELRLCLGPQGSLGVFEGELRAVGMRFRV